MNADRPTRTRRGRGDDGFTLVEQLVTVVLLGLVMTAVAALVLTLVSASSRHRDLSEASAQLATTAERLASVDTPWEPCALPGSYAAALPAGAQVVAVRYWDGTSFQAATAGNCPGAGGAPIQQLTLEVTSGRATERVDVVKWNPGA